MGHSYIELMTLFDETFFLPFNTRLIRGDDEPIYLPATNVVPFNQVVFAHGFYASALHEIAHWCVAGKQRREQIDYGYWYNGDGRDAKQQKAFERVELTPQAVEWALSLSAGFKFDVSCDNLDGAEPDRGAFREKVLDRVAHHLDVGFPARAKQFMQVLSSHYQQPYPMTLQQFEASSTAHSSI